MYALNRLRTLIMAIAVIVLALPGIVFAAGNSTIIQLVGNVTFRLRADTTRLLVNTPANSAKENRPQMQMVLSGIPNSTKRDPSTDASGTDRNSPP